MDIQKVREKFGEVADALRNSQPTALLLVILLIVAGFVLVIVMDGFIKKRKWRGRNTLRARHWRRR